ncbi:hypothetical protein HaLaN_04567, partial [Haematococcus lacustris]
VPSPYAHHLRLRLSSWALQQCCMKYELREDEHMRLTNDKKIAEHFLVVSGKDNDFVGSHKTHVKAAKPVKELPNERMVRFHCNGLKVINRMGVAGRLLHM